MGSATGATSRGRMMRAAIELIAADGFRVTTAEAIADRAGATPDEFEAEFGTKAACFLAACEEAVNGMVEHVREACASAPRASGAVGHALDSLLAYLAEDPDVPRAFVIEQFEMGREGVRHRDNMLEAFTRMLSDALEGGRFRPDADPLLCEAAVGGVYHLISRRMRTEGPEALPRLGPELTETVAALVGREELAR